MKAIPWWLFGYVTKKDDMYVGCEGQLSDKKGNKCEVFEGCNKRLYSELEGDELVLNRIIVQDGSFYGEEYARFAYNEKHNMPELISGNRDCIYELSDYYITNSHIGVYAFTCMIMARQSWYYDYAKAGFDSPTENNCHKFFLKMMCGYLDMVEQLMEYHNIPAVAECIKKPPYIGSEDCRRDRRIIENAAYNGEMLYKTFPKKVMSLMADSNIPASIAMILCKYNEKELDALFKVVDAFGGRRTDVAQILCDAEIQSIKKLTDYFIKQYVSSSYFVGKRKTVKEWFRTYIDYLNIKKPEDKMMPKNLQKAHDDALNYYKNADYDIVAFLRAVSKYKHYVWEYNEWSMEVPSRYEDLVEEGKKQHNCVSGYLNSIIKGYSKICFLRRNGNPYITVEVKEDKVVQTRAACNKKISDDDYKILKKWALEKNLEIGGEL